MGPISSLKIIYKYFGQTDHVASGSYCINTLAPGICDSNFKSTNPNFTVNWTPGKSFQWSFNENTSEGIWKCCLQNVCIPDALTEISHRTQNIYHALHTPYIMADSQQCKSPFLLVCGVYICCCPFTVNTQNLSGIQCTECFHYIRFRSCCSSIFHRIFAYYTWHIHCLNTYILHAGTTKMLHL